MRGKNTTLHGCILVVGCGLVISLRSWRIIVGRNEPAGDCAAQARYWTVFIALHGLFRISQLWQTFRGRGLRATETCGILIIRARWRYCWYWSSRLMKALV